jgi:hypothetical protein
VLQHQQQVATAVERAKQVTMTELNAIIGVSSSLLGPLSHFSFYLCVFVSMNVTCLLFEADGVSKSIVLLVTISLGLAYHCLQDKEPVP